MDHATKQDYIHAHLTRANDDLQTARDNLHHQHWRGAINRAYYVIFHAASAALLWINIERSKHSGVQSAFGEFLIKSGSIESELGQIYSRTRKARETEDYDVMSTPPTAKTATQIVDDAERFYSRMERYLIEEGAM